MFEFHRIFYNTYNQLPSFLRESQEAADIISRKIIKFPLARQDLNYKLASDYLNGKSAWLDDYILENNSLIEEVKFRHMPKIIVYNPNSLSTVFRIVVTPNRQLSSTEDPSIKLSHNSCVREYAMVLPSIESISMLDNLAVLPKELDLRDGFKS